MKQTSNKKGFLLIEMLVAVFIFTIVMLLSITAVLAILDANRKNQSMKSVINNLNLVVNSMAKNIAVSKFYYCDDDPGLNYPTGYDGGDCPHEEGLPPEPGETITFYFQDPKEGGLPHVIKYSIGEYTDSGGQKIAGNVTRSIDDDAPVPITSPDVNITSLQFYIFGTEPLRVDAGGVADGDTVQPRVVMVVRGYAGIKENTRTQFNIQTSVSQRGLDVIYE